MTEIETMDEDGQNDSSATESSESEAELMITTRERRKTAGNRYSQIAAQEQVEEDEEDDVALLFAEADEEDEEYNSDEADDEADMSSSDDDDQGPNAAPDDLDGEKEIEKQAKAERQRKRKADMALTSMSAIRKKPKIDPTSLHRAPDRPKPSKRKERVSWMPDQDAAPGRTSLRKQTVAHREIMLERFKESEEQRLKHKAQREQKERLKQAEAPRELTQADRLAEAERIEKKNAKSLNRWEATERKRAEEQAARLAALKERKLESAVITFYSSAHIFHGPKVERLSPGPSGTEEVQAKKRGPKPKALKALMQASAATGGSGLVSSPLAQVSIGEPQQPKAYLPATSLRTTPDHTGPRPQNDGWLTGIHDFASIQSNSGNPAAKQTHESEPGVMENVKQEKDTDTVTETAETKQTTEEGDDTTATKLTLQQKQDEVQETRTQTLAAHAPEYTDLHDTSTAIREPITSDSQTMPLSIVPRQTEALTAPSQVTESQVDGQQTQVVTTTSQLPDTIPVAEQPMPEIEVKSIRNLVILERFEELAADAMQSFNFLYNKKSTKSTRPAKNSAELCAISGLPAKYRDPETKVGYANIAAFKKLREVQKHAFQWSSMLNCYVGRNGHVARGVPDGFLNQSVGS